MLNMRKVRSVLVSAVDFRSARSRPARRLATSAFLALGFLLAIGNSGSAATFWDGPTITFTKADYADWTDPANQDRLTDNVWLTRADTRQLFNIVIETEAGGYGSNSPLDTEWARGSLADYLTLSYKNLVDFANGWPESGLVGVNGVLHLKTDNIYIGIKFTSWTARGGGGFAYVRTTADPTPSIWTADTDTKWGEATNWNPSGIPDVAGANVTFGQQDSAKPTVDLEGVGRTVGLMTFAATTGTTLQNGSLTFDRSGLRSKIHVEGNTHSIAVPVSLNNDLLVYGEGTLTMSGNISGIGKNLTMFGPGTLTLSGTNTYTGGTSLDAGTLQFAALGSLGSGNVTFKGGTLRYSTGFNADVSGRIEPVASGQVAKIDTNNNDVSFGTPISGDGGLSKYGAGTLAFDVQHAYTGPTTVYAGTLLVNTGTVATLNVPAGIATINAAAVATNAKVSGTGQLGVDGTVGKLTVTGGTVTTGTGAQVNSASLGGGIVNASNPLTITTQLSLPLVLYSADYTAGGSATSFTATGSNIANNNAARTLSLAGGTLKLGKSKVTAGLDIRAWQGVDGQIEGSLFDLPGSPTHSTFDNTIGYATGAIDQHGTDWFTTSGSGVETGPRPTGYEEHFTVEYRGKLKIDVGGTYRFATSSDDGSALWIDPSVSNPNYDAAAVQNNYYQPDTLRESGQIDLAAGYHDFIVRFYQGGGGYDLRVLWDPNGGTVYGNIPGANYFHVSGYEIVNLPNTNIALTASSSLDLQSSSADHTLGALTLGGAGTELTLTGANSVSFDNISATGNSSIAAGVPISLRSGDVTVAATKTLMANAAIVDGTSPTALNKLGEGTLALAAANTYTGETTVSNGTLMLNATGLIASTMLNVVDGTFDASLAASLPTFTSIKGAGTIDAGTKAVTLAAGGTLAPGNSPGMITLVSDLDISAMAGTGGLLFELGADTTAGTTYDQVSMAGNALNVGTLDFADFTFTPLAGFGIGIYTLFDAGSVSGSLGTATGTIGTYDGALSINTGTGDVNLTITPEPATLALVVLGGVGILARRRRRA